jgi:hypothetical protein
MALMALSPDLSYKGGWLEHLIDQVNIHVGRRAFLLDDLLLTCTAFQLSFIPFEQRLRPTALSAIAVAKRILLRQPKSSSSLPS